MSSDLRVPNANSQFEFKNLQNYKIKMFENCFEKPNVKSAKHVMKNNVKFDWLWARKFTRLAFDSGSRIFQIGTDIQTLGKLILAQNAFSTGVGIG